MEEWADFSTKPEDEDEEGDEQDSSGTADVSMRDGVVPEYAAAAKRYFGEDQGKAWVENVSGMVKRMGRIAVRPDFLEPLILRSLR